MDRRIFLAGALALGLASPASAEGDFAHFLESLRASARAQKIPDALFDQAAVGLRFDESLAQRRATQSEFIRPLKNYVDEAASPARAAKGRALLQKYAGPLNIASDRFGVPPEILVALWGMESDYGAQKGDRDVLRSLASLAFLHPDNPVYAEEFIAGLQMLQQGVAREKLRGSWAGAMGDPQFEPSAFLKYAVGFSGGAPDIWSNVLDSLASIANFLAQSGWVRGVAPLIEVKTPPNFSYAALKSDFSQFSAEGVAALGPVKAPASGEAMLFFPAGAPSPAFLLSANFFVLKAYNFSDSYAFAAAVLADRIAGRAVLREAWPVETQPLTLAEREKIQQALTASGVYSDKIDGRFGPNTRLAIHAFQRRAGLAPADGFPSRALLDALKK